MILFRNTQIITAKFTLLHRVGRIPSRWILIGGTIGVTALLTLALAWPTYIITRSTHNAPVGQSQALIQPIPPGQPVTATVPVTDAGTLPTDLVTATATATAPTATPAVTSTQAVTSIQAVTSTQVLTTPGESPVGSDLASTDTAITAEVVATPTLETVASPVTQPVETDGAELDGTVISNRTGVNAQFFVEGQTYNLAPGTAMGLQLPRVTALLNLYNCAAASDDSCYWDPYLLQRNGFYEIYTGADVGDTSLLLLREAGTPPANQIWVQNRTGVPESVVYRNDVYELAPTTVLELPAAPDLPVILYVRSCIAADNQTVCEWSPKSLEAGVYYAMLQTETSGTVPGSRLSAVDLHPIVSQSGGEVVTASLQLVCRLQVPALNIRSGPGLQFQITGKVRSGEEPGTVVVVGRNPEADWLAVDSSVVEGGWVTSNINFILCDGDVGTLPIVEVTDGRLANVPVVEPETNPTQSQDTITDQTASPEQTEPAEEVPTADAESSPSPVPDVEAIPEGQSLLVVNNGFQYDIRFTLDQIYRIEEGPSEYDLQPGQSVVLRVYPGQVSFTASSPWNGLSGNAALEVEEQQSVTLWLRFEPDPDGSSQWNLAWN